MSDYPKSFDCMLAAWNEPDHTLMRGLLEQALHPEVRFVDPSIDVSGIDGFEANVLDVQAKIPGAKYSRQSGIDTQHNFHRYHWAIHLDGEQLIEGFDVVETDDSGLVRCVIGFFGPVPER